MQNRSVTAKPTTPRMNKEPPNKARILYVQPLILSLFSDVFLMSYISVADMEDCVWRSVIQ